MVADFYAASAQNYSTLQGQRACGLLFVPAAAALVAGRFTRKWHYVFAVAVAAVVALAFIGGRV